MDNLTTYQSPRLRQPQDATRQGAELSGRQAQRDELPVCITQPDDGVAGVPVLPDGDDAGHVDAAAVA